MILKKFLKFPKSDPYDYYKMDSHKKKIVYMTPHFIFKNKHYSRSSSLSNRNYFIVSLFVVSSQTQVYGDRMIR